MRRAGVVTVAENNGTVTLATMNDRDFRIVRPSHATAFELVP